MLLPTGLSLTLLSLLLATSCTLFGPATAQFPGGFPGGGLPGGGGACTPGSTPPPELRPLDNDAGSGLFLDLLPNCSLTDNQVQKSAISETTAQQLALCNSFCINRVFSGNFARSNAQKQSIPGYPVWLLATVSYLLSEDGLNGTDCVFGDNSNRCNRVCNRFLPVSAFPITMPGGYTLALDCKLGCMLQFESPASTTCPDDCRMNCNSVACQCPFFGDGCFADVAPPCGRDCSATSCGLGSTDANSYTCSTPNYPSSANPTQAPVVTQIRGTRHMINITNSIPSGVSSDLGYSTLIIRVHDLSSATQDDYTYYVLENGFEFDLAPFECRRVNISFAVATSQMAVSSYSPSAVLEVPAGAIFPDQLTDFNFTVESDTRVGFFQHHIIHLEWDSPQNIEFATGYTITLLPLSNPDVCLRATYIANQSLTSYTIQSSIPATQPPITNCIYSIQIEVNPRERGSAFQKTTPQLAYNYPSTDNVQYSCTSVLDRSATAYDITFHIRFDDTFTPAVISAIRNLTASSFEINERGGAIVGVITRKPVPLPSSVTQGPVTFDVLFDNFAQQTNGLGYSLTVTLEWHSTPRDPPAIRVICNTYDVQPIAPDSVENLTITFLRAIPQSDTPSDSSGRFDRIFIILRYTWMPPEFQGEGITGYQAWLNKVLGPNDQTGNLHQIGLTTSDELRTVFDASDITFTLYFQVRAISINTQSHWTEPILLPFPVPYKMTEDDFNITSFTYQVMSEAENLTLAVLVQLDLRPPNVETGTISQFDVYLGAVDARNQSASIQTTSVINKIHGSVVTFGVANFDNFVVSNLNSQVFLQIRGRSNFSFVGEWSEPEILTFQRVPPPTNIEITGPIRDISRTQFGDNLMISRLSIPLRWIPPSGVVVIDGYEVVVSRQVITQRYADPTSDSVFNSGDVTGGLSVVEFPDLRLSNESSLGQLTVFVQMRTRASSILKSGGGEWSVPVEVTIPPQPEPVSEERFTIIRFTYNVMSNERRVDVEIILNIRPPPISSPGNITMYIVYVDRTPLGDLQAGSLIANTHSLTVIDSLPCHSTSLMGPIAMSQSCYIRVSEEG